MATVLILRLTTVSAIMTTIIRGEMIVVKIKMTVRVRKMTVMIIKAKNSDNKRDNKNHNNNYNINNNSLTTLKNILADLI